LTLRRYMKELAIEDVLGVDFLDPPDRDGLVQACKQLFLLGALDRDGAITKQGRQIAKIPVEPALGRALLAAAAGDVLPETLTVVAMLGCEEGGGVWIRPGESHARAQADSARAHFARDGLGDQVALLRCYAEWLERGRHPRWCKEHWVHSRALSLCEKLRDLLLKSLRSAVGADERAGGGRLRFDRTTMQRLRQALCYGLYHLRVTSIAAAGEES
jgi:HrpA-like RNA helicase